MADKLTILHDNGTETKVVPLKAWTPYDYYVLDDIINIISSLVKEKVTQKATAEHLGISEQYLGDILAGRRSPGDKALQKLGFVRQIVYFKTD